MEWEVKKIAASCVESEVFPLIHKLNFSNLFYLGSFSKVFSHTSTFRGLFQVSLSSRAK